MFKKAMCSVSIEFWRDKTSCQLPLTTANVPADPKALYVLFVPRSGQGLVLKP